ncbi:MAG: gliding motility-associated ABC transporter ATP-binding subunit GldA [Cyclobacteriaceae bacterium]
MSVEVNSLVKIFGVQRAIDAISFTANPGEILGFLGPNGAGKSTTMKIATCYLPPTEGTVKVCGLDVLDHAYEIKRLIGYLPEHNPLYTDMYVHEYLKFCGGLYLGRGKKLTARVHEVVERCGLTLEQNKKIGALSKGYRQRVGLAQALLHNPQVLILDEPTTGLDPNQIIEIRKLIKQESSDKTVILSTHIMQEVKALCDKVVIINKGKVVADAVPNDLAGMLSGSKFVLVEFREHIPVEALQAIPGILQVTKQNDFSWKLSVDPEKDVRDAIFHFAKENGFTLIGLQQEENTMEDVFRSLTDYNSGS